MKTMKDFNGTQGEFEIMGNKIQVDPDHPMKTITIAMMCGSIGFEENHANARLFANSKRVLEAAIEYKKAVEAFVITDNAADFDNVMIKEKELEQAINDSL